MIGSVVRGLALSLILALPLSAGEIQSSVDAGALPKKKVTPLGLYLTPADAQAALSENDGIVFLDVRDPIEINFVGHAAGLDAIVPLRTATYDFNDKSGKYGMKANPDFVAQVDAIMAREGKSKSDPVFVICRSGARSAGGVRKLIKAGYTNAWNLVEGFEGDKDKATGQRTRNGWRNAGLPWTYKIDPKAAWRPAGR